MHLHNCRSLEEHQSLLLQSLRALSFAPGGPGDIWKYLEVLVRSTGVSGRFECGSRTDLHFADVGAQMESSLMPVDGVERYARSLMLHSGVNFIS
jgi:hypothetical protein